MIFKFVPLRKKFTKVKSHLKEKTSTICNSSKLCLSQFLFWVWRKRSDQILWNL